MTKPKDNTSNPSKDKCQTPPYALGPLLPYLKQFNDVIWEPAEGEGLLVRWLDQALDVPILGTDIRTGHDFFTFETELPYQAIVTNPPFSLKFPWLERCYALGKPFALLMPSDALFAQRAQRLFAVHGIDIILMSPRIDFKMPNAGWGGAAQFSTAWFTWQMMPRLDRPIQISIADISAEKNEFKALLKENPDAF